MGVKLTWLSIEGKDRAVILRDLRVKSGGGAPITHVSEETVGRPLSNGAYLVVAMNDFGRHLEPTLLQTVSRGADVLVCHVHEGCMYSHAARWRDGMEIWRVEHDSDQGVRHLDVTGEPPPELGRIRAAQEAAQAAEPRKKLRAAPDAASSAKLWGLPPDLLQKIAQASSPPAVALMPSMDVDHLFDVPINLCEALTGLRHDRDDFHHDPLFECLVPNA